MKNQGREELLQEVTNAIKTTFKEALSCIELIATSQAQYKKIRGKILRTGNNQIRYLEEKFKQYYIQPKLNEIIRFEGDNEG